MNIVGPRCSFFAQFGGGGYVAMCYEIFLGRELDDVRVAEERGHWSGDKILRSILGSEEFAATVRCLFAGERLPENLFREQLAISQRFWLAENLPISAECLEMVWSATDYRALLVSLLKDEQLMRAAGLSVVSNLPELKEEDRADGEQDEAGSARAEDARPLWTNDARAEHLWR